MNQEGALKSIREEFVNYNLLPGRTRSYLESMGLTWFWAYKLRSIKVAHRLLRDNPFRSLMTVFGSPYLPDVPGVSIGSPIMDNALSVIEDGRAGYSVGLVSAYRFPADIRVFLSDVSVEPYADIIEQGIRVQFELSAPPPKPEKRVFSDGEKLRHRAGSEKQGRCVTIRHPTGGQTHDIQWHD